MKTGLLVCVGLVLASSACGPMPTKGDFTSQRKVPFFKILTYEQFTLQGLANVTVMLFEDEAGNCYITSGTDGGINNAPKSACEKARNPNVEAK